MCSTVVDCGGRGGEGGGTHPPPCLYWVAKQRIPFTEGVHLLQRPDYDAAARSVAVSLAAGDPPSFFPLGMSP